VPGVKKLQLKQMTDGHSKSQMKQNALEKNKRGIGRLEKRREHNEEKTSFWA